VDTFAAYRQTRARVSDLVTGANQRELDRVVPACPDWRARDLIAHLVALPAALGGGRRPNGDLQEWLDLLVAERTSQDVGSLLAEWHALDDRLPALLNGPAGLLFDDLGVHEHDLRAALDRPDHSALNTDELLPRILEAFSRRLQEAGLDAIAVRAGGRSWATHPGEAGWTLLVDPWEAVRALASRRTEAELLSLPALGDAAAYVSVLNDHLPLPLKTLAEV
jgi:hypothetical protein